MLVSIGEKHTRRTAFFQDYLWISPKETLLEDFKKLQDISQIENICAAINSICTTPDITDTLNELQNVISAIPEPTEQDKALEFLIIAQERLEAIAVRLRVKKKVQNLNAMWYKEFAKNFATQGDFGHESP